MPSAERNKRKREEKLRQTASKMPKLSTFFATSITPDDGQQSAELQHLQSAQQSAEPVLQLQHGCTLDWCSQSRPYHPTDEDIQKTTAKKRLCPLSIFRHTPGLHIV